MLTKFNKIEKTVSIFIVLGLILLLSSLALIGRGKRLFSKKYYYHTIIKSGEGLNKGMAVNMNGFQIGALENTTLDDNNNVELKIAIFEEHKKRIKEGSIVRLVSPLFGSKTLEILPGDVNSPEVKADGNLIAFDSDYGKKLLLEKRGEMPLSPVESIMLNFSDMIQKLNASNGPLFSNLENFNVIGKNIMKVSERIASNQDKIDNIFKHAESTTKNIDTMSKSVMQSSFFKDSKNKKQEKTSIDLNESYSPYKNK
jgi:hypothetical protein